MSPGTLITSPLSAVSLGMALMFGTAGLPHILMRFFTVADAKAARKSVFYATGFIGYFYILTFIIGFGAITLVSTNPQYPHRRGQGSRGDQGRVEHGGDPSLRTRSAATSSSASSRRWPSPRSSRSCPV